MRLARSGGKVIAGATAYAINWNTDVNAQVLPKVASLYREVLNSAYVDWLSEYSTASLAGADGRPGSNQRIGRGTLGGQFTLNPQVTAKAITDLQIQQELSHQIDIGVLPAPDDDGYYAVNFPVDISITGSAGRSCVDFCACHGTFKRGGQDVYYAVLPSLEPSGGCATGCGTADWLGNTTSAATHELIEAITDAEVGLTSTVQRPLAWITSAGQEIGDLCNQVRGTITGRDGIQYVVQKRRSRWIRVRHADHGLSRHR